MGWYSDWQLSNINVNTKQIAKAAEEANKTEEEKNGDTLIAGIVILIVLGVFLWTTNPFLVLLPAIVMILWFIYKIHKRNEEKERRFELEKASKSDCERLISMIPSGHVDVKIELRNGFQKLYNARVNGIISESNYHDYVSELKVAIEKDYGFGIEVGELSTSGKPDVFEQLVKDKCLGKINQIEFRRHLSEIEQLQTGKISLNQIYQAENMKIDFDNDNLHLQGETIDVFTQLVKLKKIGLLGSKDYEVYLNKLVKDVENDYYGSFKNSKEVTDKKRKTRFTFNDYSIPLGAALVFAKDKSKIAIVSDGISKVKFNDHEYSLTALAQKLMAEYNGTTTTQGVKCFEYKGELLIDFRNRIDNL